MTVNVIGAMVLQIPAQVIEWAPRNWSKREAWGDVPDGVYVTKSGEIYRLCKHLVIYVTEEAYLQ